MQEPREPPFTCLSIDSVITRLDELTKRGGALEELRDQNEALRRWGAYWKDLYEGTESLVSKLESKVKNLNRKWKNWRTPQARLARDATLSTDHTWNTALQVGGRIHSNAPNGEGRKGDQVGQESGKQSV